MKWNDINNEESHMVMFPLLAWVTADVCLLEVMPGPCRGNYSRWFYDQTLGICSQFAFGGCKGNGNNFLTENECMQRCIRGRSKGQDMATVGLWLLVLWWQCLTFFITLDLKGEDSLSLKFWIEYSNFSLHFLMMLWETLVIKIIASCF